MTVGDGTLALATFCHKKRSQLLIPTWIKREELQSHLYVHIVGFGTTFGDDGDVIQFFSVRPLFSILRATTDSRSDSSDSTEAPASYCSCRQHSHFLFSFLLSLNIELKESHSLNLFTLQTSTKDTILPFANATEAHSPACLEQRMKARNKNQAPASRRGPATWRKPMLPLAKTFLLPCILLLTYSHARMAPRLSPLVMPPGGSAFAEFIRRGHSHNDYHQEDPLSSALKHGLNSVEVDVFPRDGNLLVAHTVFELNKSRTIENMYISPILIMLRQSGMTTADPRVTVYKDSRPFPRSHRQQRRGLKLIDFGGSRVRNSPLDHEDDALTLLVDFKADAEKSISLLHKALEPLRPYLSKIDKDGKLRKGKLTVVVSGNRPRVESLRSRDGSGDRFIFIDGRSHDIHSATDSMLVPMVSLPWRKLQLARLIGRGDHYMRHMAQKAHDQGKRLRIWGAPNCESLWTQMVRNNVDLLSIDDHRKFARFASQASIYAVR